MSGLCRIVSAGETFSATFGFLSTVKFPPPLGSRFLNRNLGIDFQRLASHVARGTLNRFDHLDVTRAPAQIPAQRVANLRDRRIGNLDPAALWPT